MYCTLRLITSNRTHAINIEHLYYRSGQCSQTMPSKYNTICMYAVQSNPEFREQLANVNSH